MAQAQWKLHVCQNVTVLLDLTTNIAVLPVTVDQLEKKNPGIFGPNGGYSRALSICSMGWTVGSFIGPILSGLIKDHLAYYEMSCTLSKYIHDDPNQCYILNYVDANFSQRPCVLYLVSWHLSVLFPKRRPVNITLMKSNRRCRIGVTGWISYFVYYDSVSFLAYYCLHVIPQRPHKILDHVRSNSYHTSKTALRDKRIYQFAYEFAFRIHGFVCFTISWPQEWWQW